MLILVCFVLHKVLRGDERPRASGIEVHLDPELVGRLFYAILNGSQVLFLASGPEQRARIL